MGALPQFFFAHVHQPANRVRQTWRSSLNATLALFCWSIQAGNLEKVWRCFRTVAVLLMYLALLRWPAGVLVQRDVASRWRLSPSTFLAMRIVPALGRLSRFFFLDPHVRDACGQI